MDIFNKANSFAKTAADKAGEVMENTRLKVQIADDEKAIRKLENKIGAYYYRKFSSGGEVDEEVKEYCTAISVHMEEIRERKAALHSGHAEAEKDNGTAEDSDPFA